MRCYAFKGQSERWNTISGCGSGTGLSCFDEDYIRLRLRALESFEEVVRSGDSSIASPDDQNIAGTWKISGRAVHVQLMEFCSPERESRLFAR